MIMWKHLIKQKPNKEAKDLILLDNFGLMHHGKFDDGKYWYYMNGAWFEYNEPTDTESVSSYFVAYMETEPFHGFTDIPSKQFDDEQKNLTYEEFIKKMEKWLSCSYKADRVASNVLWLCAEYPEFAKTYRDSLSWTTMD